MDRNVSSFTVCFQPPFWVGIAERWTADGYEAARVVFGPEPSDAQIYQWLGVEWHKLRFSPAAPGERARVRPEKPKACPAGGQKRPWRAPELAPEPSRPWPESGSRRENGSARSGGSAASSRRRSGSVCASRKSAKKRGGGDAPGPEGRGRSPAALRHENR